jgi:hypothetical protein
MLLLFNGFEKWITDHSITVQALTAIFGAFLTLILVATTIAYLIESHKSRQATERQAAAAQEQLLILKHEYEDRIGEGPEIVRHAIAAGLDSIMLWLGQVALGNYQPDRVADPADMIPAELAAAAGHARRISSECSEEFRSAISEMRLARTSIQTLRQSGQHGPHAVRGDRTLPIVQILERAREHLKNALKSVPAKPGNM